MVALHLTGDRVVRRALETREVSRLPNDHYTNANWISKLVGFKTLRHITASRCFYLQVSLEGAQWPPNLTVLHLDFESVTQPFFVHSSEEVPAKSAELRLMFPHLEDLLCYTMISGRIWVFPPKLQKIVIRGGLMLPVAILSLPLLTLDTLNVNLESLDANQFPSTIESLTFHVIHDWWEALFRVGALPALKSVSLRSHQLLTRTLQDSLAKMNRLESLTLKGACIRNDWKNFGHWLPPNLQTLTLPYLICPTQYACLPRTLTQVFYIHPIGDLMPFKWDVEKVLITDLPPALHTITLASQVRSKQSCILKGLDQQFKSLTSLDMRWTNVEVSELRHIPPTVRCLHLLAVTLPKARLLNELFPKLVEFGMYGGTLTKSIAKCLPRKLQTLSLSHVSLVVKGHHHPSGDPKAAVPYSEASNPQLDALAHLPPRIVTFALFPSNAHKYWKQNLGSILFKLPFTTTLDKLILDFGTRNNGRSTAVRWGSAGGGLEGSSQGDSLSAFSQFVNLRHLYLSGETLDPAGPEVLAHLPPRLEALRLPESVWEASETSAPDSIHAHPALAEKIRASWPSSLGFANYVRSEYWPATREITRYYRYKSRHVGPPISARSRLSLQVER